MTSWELYQKLQPTNPTSHRITLLFPDLSVVRRDAYPLRSWQTIGLPNTQFSNEAHGVFIVLRHGPRTPVSFDVYYRTLANPFRGESGPGALTRHGYEQAREFGAQVRMCYPGWSPGQVSLLATTAPRCVHSAMAIFAGCFPGAPIPAVEQFDNLSPSKNPCFRLAIHSCPDSLRFTWYWDLIESLCANGYHDSVPLVFYIPWVTAHIELAAHRHATQPFKDPKLLRLAALPTTRIIKAKVEAIASTHSRTGSGSLEVFTAHDWTINMIRRVVGLPITYRWVPHLDSLVIELHDGLDAGDPYSVHILTLDNRPLVMPLAEFLHRMDSDRQHDARADDALASAEPSDKPTPESLSCGCPAGDRGDDVEIMFCHTVAVNCTSRKSPPPPLLHVRRSPSAASHITRRKHQTLAGQLPRARSLGSQRRGKVYG